MVFCLDTLHGCSDTLHGCSNTLHGYSDRMYAFSFIPRKLYTILQPTFFPIKRYQDILIKRLTLSTDSVTKKRTVVRAVYFYNSGSIFATKTFVTEAVLKVKLYEGIVRSGKMWAGKWQITFLVKKKKKEKSLLNFDLNIIVEKKDIYPCSVSKQKPCDYPSWSLFLANELQEKENMGRDIFFISLTYLSSLTIT